MKPHGQIQMLYTTTNYFHQQNHSAGQEWTKIMQSSVATLLRNAFTGSGV